MSHFIANSLLLLCLCFSLFSKGEEQKKINPIPLDISADEGIEVFEKDHHIVAKGNVVAERENDLLFANLAHAYYTEGKKRKIDRLNGIGDVILVNPEGTLYADDALYNMPQDTLTFTGKQLRFEGYEGRLFARDKFLYRPNQKVAEAYGDVKIYHLDDLLTADYVKATFKEEATTSSPQKEQNDHGNSLSLDHLDAKGHVVLTQPLRTIWCDNASYDASKDFLICEGNARIQDKDGIAEGDHAEIDRKTGISKVFSRNGLKSTSNKARIRALILQE